MDKMASNTSSDFTRADGKRAGSRGPAAFVVGVLQPRVTKLLRHAGQTGGVPTYWELNITLEDANCVGMDNAAQAFAVLVAAEAVELEREDKAAAGLSEAVAGGLVVCGCDGSENLRPKDMLKQAIDLTPDELYERRAYAERSHAGYAFVASAEAKQASHKVYADAPCQEHCLRLRCSYEGGSTAYEVYEYALVGRAAPTCSDLIGVPVLNVTRVQNGRAHGSFEVGCHGSWFYTDEGSTNGSTVNGVIIPAHMSKRLRVGDKIVLGGAATLTVCSAS